MKFTLKMRASKYTPARKIECASLAEASAAYVTVRDDSGEGGSTFREAVILAADGARYRVSYNGKVWADGEWKPGDVPVYSPYAAIAA